MKTISAMGGTPPNTLLLQKLQQRNLQVTSQASTTLHATGSSTHPARSLSMLTFGRNAVKFGNAVKLEADFIRQMKRSKNPDEKAGLVELLGRARSMNAVPHLLKLLDEKEHVKVRTASAVALSTIGQSTHKNSFMSVELANALMDTYKQRSEAMKQRMDEPKLLGYDEKLKEETSRKDLLNEMQTLAVGASQLDVLRTNQALLKEYYATLALAQEHKEATDGLRQIIDIAQQEFRKDLQKRYNKPWDEITQSIHPRELEEMQKKVVIKTADGDSFSLLEALLQIGLMEDQQVNVSREMLSGLMDALAVHNKSETNAALKVAVDSDYSEVKAKSLSVLGPRNQLNYSSDIYPNLKAENKDVRKAALNALLSCQDPLARQKTVELSNPQNYFDLVGGISKQKMRGFVQFLGGMAKQGDDYVQLLSNQAMHPDMDVQSREIALLTLSMMTEAPAAREVSPQTRIQAKTAIKLLAMGAPARKQTDADSIGLLATQLWVGTGDPTAIPAAILKADNQKHRLSGEDQEALLASVFTVLNEEASRANKPENEAAHRILNTLSRHQSPLLSSPELEHALREELSDGRMVNRVNPKRLDDFLAENGDLEPDTSMIELLQPIVPKLHSALTNLAESEKSDTAQMLAFRVMGLLKDEDSISYLINRVRDPLKDKIDWKADVSYRSDPAIVGANLRLNALTALGDLGDSRALPVMTDTLEDPVLKHYVNDSLAKIAPHANEHAPEASLTKVKNKLLKLIGSPDNSRSMRATRISASNTLYQFKGGAEALKEFAAKSAEPNFKRQALSAFLSNNVEVDEAHPDYELLKPLIYPGLGVEKLHADGISGKGVELAIVDGGYVDPTNKEGFQDRVKVPAQFNGPEHSHPSMVMSTAAANGKLKGVAPGATVYSDKWPDFDSKDPMDVYKKMIEGKLRGENNIRVINNSWGFSNPNAILYKDVRELLLEYKKVVDLAEKAGIQFVFAAGNEGEEPGFPKLGTVSVFGVDMDKLTSEDKKLRDYILDKVITVGAINTQGSDKRADHRLTEFSSVGDNLNRKLAPTVVAPGADMMVYGWGKNKGNPKQLVNGTSFSSPYVTGLIALMLQKNPALAPADIREILKKTAAPLRGVPVSHQGAGEVVPEKAVTMAATYEPPGSKKVAPGPKPPMAPPPPSEPSTSGTRSRRRPPQPAEGVQTEGVQKFQGEAQRPFFNFPDLRLGPRKSGPMAPEPRQSSGQKRLFSEVTPDPRPSSAPAQYGIRESASKKPRLEEAQSRPQSASRDLDESSEKIKSQ